MPSFIDDKAVAEVRYCLKVSDVSSSLPVYGRSNRLYFLCQFERSRERCRFRLRLSASDRLKLDTTQKAKLVENFDHLKSMKYAKTTPKAFTEKGMYMLATIIDRQ